MPLSVSAFKGCECAFSWAALSLMGPEPHVVSDHGSWLFLSMCRVCGPYPTCRERSIGPRKDQ